MPFLAAWESNFLSRFLIPLALWGSMLYVRPHDSKTEHMVFFKARCSREPSSRLSTRFLSHFCLLPKVSGANVHWAIAYHTFLSHITSSSTHFLACHMPLLSPHSTAWARNPQGISKLVNKGWLLLVLICFWTISQALFALDPVPVGSSRFAWWNSAGLPC
jgi:hypothetical protein